MSATPTIPTGAATLIGDISGDGRDDLVFSTSATSGGGVWSYMLGTDTGYGPANNTIFLNWNHADAQLIEWNGDGLMDLLVPCNGTSTWCVLQASSTGFVSSFNTGTPSTGSSGSVLAADLNGDGRDDLVRMAVTQLYVRIRVTSGFEPAETLAWTSPLPNMYFFNGNFSTMRGMRLRSLHRRVDFNGDGCEDFVLRMKLDEPEPESPDFVFVASFFGGGYTITGGGSVGTAFLPSSAGDFNGDGLTDLLYINTTSITTTMGQGTSFSGWVTGPPISGLQTGLVLVLDHDSDGLDDIVIPKTTPASWHVSRSQGNSFTGLTDLGLPTSWTAYGPSRAADVNGDGLGEITRTENNVVKLRLHSGVYPDFLDRATDGFGVFADFDYAPLTAGGSTYMKGTGAVYPTREYQGPMYVVSKHSTSNGIGGSYFLTYGYERARVHHQGRGFVGFWKQKITDSRNGIFTEEQFQQDTVKYASLGALEKTIVKQSSGGNTIREVTNTWDNKIYNQGTYTERRFPFVSPSIAKDYEIASPYNGTHFRTVTTTSTVDIWGTPTDIETKTTEEATGLNQFSYHKQRVLHVAVTNDTSSWCLSKPTQTQFINEHTLPGGGPITRSVDRSWNTLKCRMTQEVIEPNSTQWKVTTDHGFDDDSASGYGNLTSASVTPVGQSARVTSISWITNGRFPQSMTNPLGQTTNLTWYADLGLLATARDPNNPNPTDPKFSFEYDGFGRRTRVLEPDGTATRWILVNCDSGNIYCGFGDTLLKYRVQTDLRNTADGLIQDSYVSFDAFGRTKYLENRLVDGGYAYSRNDYDALGRVSSTLIPRIGGSNDPTKYVNIYYDLINRVTKEEREVSEADTSVQSTQWSYSGLSITQTDALSRLTTQKRSAWGQIIQAIDAAGADTDYEYNAFGDLVKTRDINSNEIIVGYNVRGMKMSSSDPDMGSWTYDYFPFGELKSQTNAKSQTVNFTFDKLSRPLTRVEPEGTTTWVWGTSAASKNIGHLASVSSPGSYSETYTYDSLARLSQTAIVADGATYNINQGYNAATGFQETLTYPTSTSGVRIKLKYSYQNGHLHKVNDFTGDVLGTTYWEAMAKNARGLVIDEELGNGLRTFSKFDHIAGWLDYRQTGPGGGTATLNLNYAWDKLGNLTQRKDENQLLTENFVYDSLNRLDFTTGVSSLDLTYNAIGNITMKSDVCLSPPTPCYTYHATKKHAVTAAGSNTYAYDANGNMSTRNGKTITWTSYDLPSLIHPTSDTNYNQFFYNAWRQRYKQVYKAGTSVETTIYVGGILEKWVNGSTTQWRHLIQVDGRTVALLNRSGTTNTVRYPLNDHLSGMAVLTNSSGGIYVKESFDAFGQRRNPATWSGSPSSGDMNLIRDATRHGFTSHEHLDNTTLIHMNGRVYDPVVGRFLSADPFVPEPFDGQSFNRFSYVHNNPLSFTDPSGFDPEDDTGPTTPTPRFPNPFWDLRPPNPPAIVPPHPRPDGPQPKETQQTICSSIATSGINPVAGEMPCFRTESTVGGLPASKVSWDDLSWFRRHVLLPMASPPIVDRSSYERMTSEEIDTAISEGIAELHDEFGSPQGPMPVRQVTRQVVRGVIDQAAVVAKAVRPRGIPAGWVEQAGRKMGHTKYVNPANPHDYVRVRPDGTITQVRNGKALDVNGNPVDLNSPTAHGITPETFIFRE